MYMLHWAALSVGCSLWYKTRKAGGNSLSWIGRLLELPPATCSLTYGLEHTRNRRCPCDLLLNGTS
jgi:hypothetical protein